MEEKTPAPEPCRASLLVVASTDPPSFVLSFLLVVIVLSAVGMFIHSKVTGFQPVEPWGEVAAGVFLIAAAIGAFVRFRWRSINRVLASGRRGKARLAHFRSASQWTIIRLVYDWNGREEEKNIWLANSGRSRALEGREEVELAFDPLHPGRFVVASLYCPRKEAAP